ncbi:hypothetical protein ACFL21_05290, partial [Patescibacteria group bacterium]
MADEDNNIEVGKEGLSESEKFAQGVEAFAEEIGVSPTALEVIDDVATGNISGLFERFVESDFFQTLGGPAAKIVNIAKAGYESISFISDKISGVLDRIFGVVDVVKEKFAVIKDGSFIDILRMLFSSESIVSVPAIYQMFKGEFGSDEFWQKLQEEGLDGTIEWLYDQAREGIIDITHEAWAPIAAALGIKKFADLDKKKEGEESEESEESDDESSAGGPPLPPPAPGSTPAPDEEEEDFELASADDETTETEVEKVINEEITPDEVFDAETEMLAEDLEFVDAIIFKWLRHYTYYLDGGESEAYEYMNKLSTKTSLLEEERHRVGELMAESGIGIFSTHGDVWVFKTFDCKLVEIMTGDQMEELLLALDFPEKDAVEYVPEDASFKVASTFIIITSALTIHEYIKGKLKGDKISVLKALGRGASWPHSIVKIMGKGAKAALGYVLKSAKGLKIYDSAGKLVQEIKLDLAEFKAFDEFKNFETKEQAEKIRNMDGEYSDLRAEEQTKLAEVDDYMNRKRLQMDDPGLMKKYQDVKNEYGNRMRRVMKQRLRFTASLETDVVKANGLEADTEIIKSLGLEAHAKGVANEPGAIMRTLAKLDLSKFKHLKKLSKLGGVAFMGAMIFGLFYGAKYLAEHEQKEFEIDTETQEATFMKRIVEAMQRKNEFLQSLIDIYYNPFGEVKGPKSGRSMSKYKIITDLDVRSAYIKQLVMELQESRAYVQDLMIIQGPIINAAFKERENPEEESLVINPFMSMKWDSDREEAYLIYPNDEEFIQTANYMINMADEERDYLKEENRSEFDDEEEWLEFISDEQRDDFLSSACPYLGGFYDLYNAAEALYVGDYATAKTNYFWGSFSVLTDPFMFGAASAGKTSVKGAAIAARGGLTAAKAGASGTSKLSKAWNATKTITKAVWDNTMKGISALEGQSARIMWGALSIQMGPLACAKLGILEQQQQYEGRYYATSEEEAQDIEFTPTQYVWYNDAPDNITIMKPEKAEEYYEGIAESMRTTYKWKNLRVDMVNNSTIKVFRATSKENILTIKKYPNDEPYEQANDGTGVWAIEGIDKGYDTFPQALVIANLCLDVQEVFEEHDYEGGSSRPFHADGDDIDVDLELGDSFQFEWSWDMPLSAAKELTQYDLEILSSDKPWLDLVQRTLGVSQGWIVNAYNNWYRHVY